MARMQRSLFAQLNALAEEISQGNTKTAAVKAAGPVPSDPGGYDGASASPTADVDNNVQKSTTGARAAEYEADIKKQQGPVSVDSTPEMSQEGRQDDVQLNIGVKAKATGEDPSAEKDFKGTKDDPGTSSPVKANDGEKYSSASFKTARQHCSNLGNDILANLINFGTAPLTKKSEEATVTETAPQQKTAADAFKAGYELAAAAGMTKEAAEASVREVCANTLREADEMAALFVGFVSAKQAAADPTEDASEGEDHSGAGDVGSGAGPSAGAGAGAPPPAELEAMLGGGGAGGEMGGEPAGHGMGGEPSSDEAVQELAMALEELGIPPEALIQALSQGAAGGAGPGGPAPAPAPGSEMPPPGPDAGPKMAADKRAQELYAIGQAVMDFKHAGKFQIKEARTKRSRELRDFMKQHVRELISR